jgi:hypothetical protein
MPIISSIYQAEPPDALDRIAIVERHVDHTGHEHMISYICDSGLDPENIMNLRAVRIGAEVDKAEAEKLAALGGVAAKSWTQVNFWKLFLVTEYAACKTMAETDPTADYLITLLKAASVIHADDPSLMVGLKYFTTIGCLAAGRAEEILNG